MSQSGGADRLAALAVMLASGFAGLGYQIVWTQQCALWLGHESAAVLAVVAAYFGGIALGALAFGQRIERSAKPAVVYAACEIIIGLWGLALMWAMAPVSGQLLRLVGPQPLPVWQWTVSFVGTLILLLPATTAMGATLPAMERVTGPAHGERRSIAALYASNTLGAVAGVLVSAFWLLPRFGLRHTTAVCVALNLLAGVAALRVFPGTRPVALTLQDRHAGRAVLMILAATGLLGIGYEVLVVRVLSEVTENSVYTYAAMLAVYLGGSALGAALYQALMGSRASRLNADRLLCVLSVSCLLSGGALWAAERVRSTLLSLGTGMPAALAAEGLLALMAFGAPTMVMGALFSDLCARAASCGVGFGRALAANTLGAAAAPLLFGVIGLPLLGAKTLLLLLACAYLLIGGRRWRTPWVLAPAVIALAIALWMPPLVFIDVPAGGRVVSYRAGTTASVSVVEDAGGVGVLRINNRQQEGSSATLRVDGRQGWLPILLHPQPRNALFLGLGTGVTSSAAAMDPDLSVEAVELLPEVIDASAYFRAPLADGLHPGQPRLLPADARRFVRTVSSHYDVIVADNFHPARSGSGALYTVEHFRAVQERLNAAGLFCQWLPLHQLDLDTLRSIVRSFLAVFPQAWALLASNSLETPVVGLIGRSDDGRLDVAALRRRLASRQGRLGVFGIEDDLALFGTFIAGPHALQRFAADAPLNTDDYPVVAFRAPRITYAPDSTPAERLLTLIREVSITPADVVQPPLDADWSRRLQAYWQARNRFLDAGRQVRAEAGLHVLLAQVRDPLLEVLHTSPDFRPAYDPLLRMAEELARTDVDGARNLLWELAQAQPARIEASTMLAELPAIR